MGQILISLENISKEFINTAGFNVSVLNDITMNIDCDDITSILSPIDAGKTTLLKIIGGLEDSTQGSINRQCRALYIPSAPSSFPWLNVSENLSFANKNITTERLKEIINRVELEGYEDHFPNNKSFGFRFRISLARAIAVDAKLIILDEPFNNFDGISKEEIYTLIKNLNNELGIGFLLGTSNISEAIYLSHKIFLMKKDPAEVVNEFTDGLPFPNNVAVMDDEKFASFHSKIETELNRIDPQRMFNFLI